MYNYLYPRPAVTCDIILVAKIKAQELLLIKRKNEPFKNKWALPGGFINMDETLQDSALRELTEETGIQLDELRQFKTYGDPGRDPRGRTITVVYYKHLEKTHITKAGDDACKAEWFELNKLPELAFDHQQIISDFLTSGLLDPL